MGFLHCVPASWTRQDWTVPPTQQLDSLVAHYGLRRGPTFSVIVTEFRYGTVTVSESLELTNMIQEFSGFFVIISIKSDSITKFLYEGRSIGIKEQHEYIVYRKR